jgi:hypothetical protein
VGNRSAKWCIRSFLATPCLEAAFVRVAASSRQAIKKQSMVWTLAGIGLIAIVSMMMH